MKSKINIKQLRIAKRYTEAIVEAASESNELQKVYEDLLLILTTCKENNNLEEFLESPVITHADKNDTAAQIFEKHISKPAFDFMRLLIDNGRFDLLEAVVGEYASKMDEINNILKVEVTSAVDFNEELKSQLINKLENLTSKKIIPHYKIDEDIIAGLVIKIGDNVIDSSLKTKLNNLKKQLI